MNFEHSTLNFEHFFIPLLPHFITNSTNTMAENKYITVAYQLFAPMQDNERELIEEATVERPFQFISALGMTLDAFEAQIAPLAPGAEFDIKLSTEEAYGPFVPEAVQKVSADIFKINGKIDSRYIYEGAVVPLQNADGERFNGTITEITEKEITVDLNHPLAGKELNFVGKVIESREATNQEIQDALNVMTGGCSGGCGGCSGGSCGSCGEGGCEGGCK